MGSCLQQEFLRGILTMMLDRQANIATAPLKLLVEKNVQVQITANSDLLPRKP